MALKRVLAHTVTTLHLSPHWMPDARGNDRGERERKEGTKGSDSKNRAGRRGEIWPVQCASSRQPERELNERRG
eukprot:1548310-Pleurochrysis_carterae.AAC.1